MLSAFNLVTLLIQVSPSLRTLSMYHVYFMCDVQDLASDIPTSLYNLLMEMREKYEEFERNIKVQNLILQNDHLEE